MKYTTLLVATYVLLVSACKKEVAQLPVSSSKQIQDTFRHYLIHKGAQYCDQNNFQPVTCTQLKFNVKFDSSAIYTTENPGNQGDINKLYGFSDNNDAHHQFSARFGWRWSSGALRLFGYIYNEGIRSFKELGTVKIGSVNLCGIKVESNTYVFTLNEKTDTLTRKSSTIQAVGYRLYPYFGGDEVAPHDINIWIKELP